MVRVLLVRRRVTEALRTCKPLGQVKADYINIKGLASVVSRRLGNDGKTWPAKAVCNACIQQTSFGSA
jgi:hypothetical protein